MSRYESTQAVNPVQRYYDWDGQGQTFSHYNSESAEQIPETLPFKFFIISERYCVRGFDENLRQGIFSNVVQYVGREELNVRWKDGNTIAKGLWRDIKGEVNANGGHYTMVIFAMSELQDLICIRLRGSAIKSWGDTVGKSRVRQNDEWISVASVGTGENERGTYYYPIFSFGGSLAKEDDEIGAQLAAELKNYRENKPVAQPVSPTPSTSMPPSATLPPPTDDDDDLPF
ncbi:hypothetical protein LZD49_07180 [Dyadobacter sp. CY261]|uniref:hypothetical protein n=1 Tax=Dyadobacter sp. CY261 TaxID=2907203 RepID=UPI001F1AFEDF|nr:hypothetical protein [Dyadobacter sp. CY261]MCF0070248.1 hypothetical protein [Dyadobacter sp. CY261]